MTFGAATFGGTGELAKRGSVDLNTARRQIDICLEAGVNLLDTANAYSRGTSEEILGEALIGKRDQVLVATKVRFAMGDGPNDEGLSRYHIITQCEASLKRLRTAHIDLYQLGEWDGLTPLDETLDALDTLVRAGKVRYVGISNFTGWQLKTMEVARTNRMVQAIAQQIHYSLETRNAEYELAQSSEELARRAAPLVGPLMEDLLLLEIRHSFQTEAVTAAERAAGTLPGTRQVTVAFADVAGFTRLGEASPPEEFENVASRLTELAHDVAGEPVRFIKSIGDALMFVSADAAPSWMPYRTSLRVPTRVVCPA